LLSLDEVPGVLRKINNEKKEWDRQNKRKEHDFFLAEGSKILVTSYAHLRREGVEGYILDFNNMIRECSRECIEYGIEILPCVPTVSGEIDVVGKMLIAGVQDWIGWIGKETGRKEMEELAKTGGIEVDEKQKGSVQYKPGFVKVEQKRDDRQRGGDRRVLEMVRGDRRELIVYAPRETEEISKLLEKRGRTGENEDEERESRKSTENGVSVEAEYTFSSAISRFTKTAKEEGRYKGSTVRNITEQLKMRARFEGKGRARKYVLLIGASEMSRMASEISKIGEQVIMQGPMVRIRGEWSADKVYQAVEQAKLCEIDPDKIVIAGPGNSQIKHGRTEIRGFGPEKRIVC
jgi:hypothetical protein